MFLLSYDLKARGVNISSNVLMQTNVSLFFIENYWIAIKLYFLVHEDSLDTCQCSRSKGSYRGGNLLHWNYQHLDSMGTYIIIYNVHVYYYITIDFCVFVKHPVS